MSNSLSGYFNAPKFRKTVIYQKLVSVFGSKNNFNTGFTLVELIVAISIVAVMSVLAIPNLRRFTEVQTLNADVGRVQTLIRQAQANTQSGVICLSDNKIATSWKVVFYGSAGNYYYVLHGTCQDGNFDQRQVVALNNNTTPIFTAISDDLPPENTTCQIPVELTSGSPEVEFQRDLTNKRSVYFNCHSSGTEVEDIATYQISFINGTLGASLAKNIIISSSGSVEVQ